MTKKKPTEPWYGSPTPSPWTPQQEAEPEPEGVES
jgi:hypothetical protein